MADVNLGLALDKLSSDKQRERKENLEVVDHVLQSLRSSSQLDALTDDGFHKVFEALFQFIRIEKARYIRASTKKAESDPSSRLASGASTVRTAIDLSNDKITSKTAIAVIDHIVDSLPTPTQTFCEPLAAPYLRGLRTILEYAPHTEHLRESVWLGLVDFVLEGLSTTSEDVHGSHSTPHGLRSFARQTSIDLASRQAPRSFQSEKLSNTEELALCLVALVLHGTNHLLSRASVLSEAMLVLLERSYFKPGTQAAAFRVLNKLLSVLETENLGLFRSLALSCLTIIRRVWPTKHAPVKEEMTVLLCLIQNMVRFENFGDEDHAYRQEIAQLYTVLFDEHVQRQKNHIFHSEQLLFCKSNPSLSFESQPFFPRLQDSVALMNFSTLSAMATLILGTIESKAAVTKISDNDRQPNKRRRIDSPLLDIFGQAHSRDDAERITSLQLICFLLGESREARKHFQDNADRLITTAAGNSGEPATWTFLAFCSFALNALDEAQTLGATWDIVWETATRHASTVSVSRSACLLLNMMIQYGLADKTKISSLFDSLYAGGSEGPPYISESALELFVTVLHRTSGESSTLKESKRDRILTWLNAKWQLSSQTDRLASNRLATYAQPALLANVLLSCANHQAGFLLQPTDPLETPIAHTIYKKSCTHDLLQFLWGSKVGGHQVKVERFKPSSRSERLGSGKTYDQLIIPLVQQKLRHFNQMWSDSIAKRSTNATRDLVAVLASTCLTAFLVAYALPNSQSATQTADLAQGTWFKVCSFLSSQGVMIVSGAKEATIHVLSSIDASDPSSRQALHLALVPLLAAGESFMKLPSGSNGTIDVGDEIPESTNLDEAQISQSSSAHARDDSAGRKRFDTPFSPTFEGHLAGLWLSLRLRNEFRLSGEDFLLQNESTRLLTTLSDVDFNDLLLARNSVAIAIKSCSSIARADACRFLKRLAETCLQDYAWERSEAALCFCLEVMQALVGLWATGEDDELYEVAYDIYGWFLEVGLEKGIVTDRVLICTAQLLGAVLDVNTDFARGDSEPSPRTHLLLLLQKGNNVVRFYATPNVLELFGHFVLSVHDDIFDDVIGSLPIDPTYLEGIALRLHVLTELACKWQTLLRRSIYHLFETPGLITGSAKFAKACVARICQKLQIGDARHLFRLFSPAILYTWLQSQTVEAIPFHVYEYSTLADLLTDVLQEVVAQSVMREDKKSLDQVSRCLGIAPDELIEKSFSKVEAYCIARDISRPRSSNGSVETSVKKQLGAPAFSQLIHVHFQSIVSALVLSTDITPEFEKAFSRHQDSEAGQSASQVIRSLGNIPTTTALSQQPCFKMKYILDELAFLCKRAILDPKTIWTPALLVYVCRDLFNASPSILGPFHACGMFRRLRLVLAMSGPTALSGYPLQMLLNTVQPYIVDFYCSEDSITICRYLLTSGKDYLQTNPKFFAGFALTSFASLLKFMDMKQDSTTQESQFQATMSRAQEFHSWLGKYVDTFKFDSKSDLTSFYQNLLKSSAAMRSGLTFSKETDEGQVFLMLLQNTHRGQNAVDIAASDAALKTLANVLKAPQSLNDDILGDDQDCVTYAQALREILKRLTVPHDFRCWAAKALGRAYSASGRLPSPGSWKTGDEVRKDSLELEDASALTALRTLSGLLLSQDTNQAGMAERTLQAIVTNLNGLKDTAALERVLSRDILDATAWSPYMCPELPNISLPMVSLLSFEDRTIESSTESWASDLAICLCLACPDHPILAFMPQLLSFNRKVAESLFPPIVHLAISSFIDAVDTSSRALLSRIFVNVLHFRSDATKTSTRVVLDTLVYLRRQRLPGESTTSDRDKWLDIDYHKAAEAAAAIKMFETALLFFEIHVSRNSQSSRTRRSSISNIGEEIRAMHTIFANLDDPDYFYGVPQEPTLESVISRLDFESVGFRSLSFQSARLDAKLRVNKNDDRQEDQGLLHSLSAANLQGLAYDLSSTQGKLYGDLSSNSAQLMAISLRQWDFQPTDDDGECLAFDVLQCANRVDSIFSIRSKLKDSLIKGLESVLADDTYGPSHEHFADLASLSEINDLFSQGNSDGMEGISEILTGRTSWMYTERLERSKLMLASREATLGTMSRRPQLSQTVNINPSQARLLEIKTVRKGLEISRNHANLQSSLNAVTYLSSLYQLTPTLDADAAVQLDLARVLWDHGEASSSVQILQRLAGRNDLQKQAIPVSRLEILAELAHHVAEQRLEKPEEIQSNYLLKAIKEVRNSPTGSISGRVYHEFASFCDKQLQNPDDLDDFNRIEQLRTRKKKEVSDLEKMMKQADGKQRDALRLHFIKAKQWFDLDDREYQRLRKIREGFLERCLTNYLLALRACDDFDNDVLRFVALWLDQSGNRNANAAIEPHIRGVASRKFAPLMNQLSSRLLDDKEDHFQKILFDLTVRICSEHPFHGMYQVFASSKSKGGRDELALSRHAAANRVADRLRESRAASNVWVTFHNTNIGFVRFALERFDDTKLKSGAKIQLSRIPSGARMEQDIVNSAVKIPPPTMKIPLRVDCDYSSIPRIARFDPSVSIAGGVSAPKIVTAIASDGSRHKQLFKGGNDDLRQDAIMEQVFEQVSSLLGRHRETRQRNLGIRTYKVLPLTANTGIIEFVQNTIPLHDYLLPAHTRHYPKDMKASQCRKQIADAQSRSVDTRLSVFKKVTDHFQPVMRYFFMERFMDPKDWFNKRLAYSRSTAAISILGHVLGLGDRHGHNILLDEKTGEVVHIDLGVAFEAGRVLPVPEVVPFRLTRDLVDGMGITGVEGVFRRCCNFTLEALRQHSYSIMTILDVLRYDPLYSWSVSPLRIKKMQESQQQAEAEAEAAAATTTGAATGAGPTTKRPTNEPSEADRALTVVEKKLGKSLSVEATVNELIQQATDERNLAVLYCGWAAYA